MIFIKADLTEQPKLKSKISSAYTMTEKIAQFTTADKLIRNFINAKTDQQKQKVSDQYKVYDKHKEKKPLGERMRTAKRDNKLTEIRRRVTQEDRSSANTEEGESGTIQNNTCIFRRPYVLQI